MNIYITTLLVVLAATGIEPQMYQSAVKVALGNYSIEQIRNDVLLRHVASDIHSVVKVYKKIAESKRTEPQKIRQSFTTKAHYRCAPSYALSTNYEREEYPYLPNPTINTAIIIRAPMC